jgi:hypothetical protein
MTCVPEVLAGAGVCPRNGLREPAVQVVASRLSIRYLRVKDW